MIPKNSGRTYRNALVLVLLLIIPGVGHSSNYPQWLQAYQDGTLKLNNVYYGVGSSNFYGDSPDDDSRRRSKDRALDELCYQLSVSIKSEFKENMVQKGKYSDQEVASSLFVSTQKVFSGIREKQKWTDPENRVLWIMVVIDKGEADRQVKQQDFVKKVVDRLSNNQEEIAAGMKKMTTVLIQQGKVHEARFNKLEKLMKTIDQKVGSAGDRTKGEYTGIKNEIQNLGNKWNKQEEMLLDQHKKMDALMSQNKALQDLIAKISENIQGDHFLALTQDDVKNQIRNPGFNVTITPLKGEGADYYKGESIRFIVKASRDCYIKVIYLSSIGEGTTAETKMNTLLFPNVHDQANHIMAGKPMIIGKKNELIVQKPFGKDIVTVVASLSQFTGLEKILRQAAEGGGYYQTVTRSVSDAVHTRGIGVIAPPSAGKTSSADGSFVSDTCFIITRKM
jgi:DNA-binding Xre family transcriptional regulator